MTSLPFVNLNADTFKEVRPCPLGRMFESVHEHDAQAPLSDVPGIEEPGQLTFRDAGCDT